MHRNELVINVSFRIYKRIQRKKRDHICFIKTEVIEVIALEIWVNFYFHLETPTINFVAHQPNDDNAFVLNHI